MELREIDRILKGENPHWVGNGFYVRQYFPDGQELEFYNRFSPFILLDYNEPYFFNATPFEIGVGPHAHRGMETVTFCLSGKLEHEDNLGNKSILNPYEIQWMTAGSGIIHKEHHESNSAKKDRVLHFIQLWVNLPKKDKFTNPKYINIRKKDLGYYYLDDEAGEVYVYSGNFRGTYGPTPTFTKINIYRVNLEKNKEIELIEPSNFNFGILFLVGEAKINNKDDVKYSDFILFKNTEGKVLIKAKEETEFMVFSGEPIDEPLVHIGPFAMNTAEEIMQANEDLENGKFGTMLF